MVFLNVPPIRGELVAEAYIDDESSSLHPAFRPTPALRDQRAEKTSQKDAADETDRFCDVMQLYMESPHGRDYSPEPRFDIRAQHDWDGVIRVARHAEERYRRDGEGVQGFGRRIMRVIGDHSRAIDPWVKLIPSEHYLSVLCGGLKLVLGIAAYRAETRERILKMFEKLQDFRLETERWTELFPDNLMVRDHSLQVYIAFLVMVEAMVSNLVEIKTWKKIRETIKLGKRSGKRKFDERSLEDKEADFHRAVQLLKDRVEYLNAQSIQRIDKGVERLQVGVSEARDDISLKIARSTEQLVENIQELASTQNAAQDNLKNILIQAMQAAEWLRLNSLRSASFKTDRNSKIRERLLVLLNTQEDEANKDLNQVRIFTQNMSGSLGEQMHWMLRHPDFTSFLNSKRPEIFLLSSGYSEFADSRYSPMSCLALALIDSLDSMPRAKAIHFFCGVHMTPRSQGPAQAMRSLISQVLSLGSSFDLNSLNHPESAARISDGDVHELCYAFKLLIQQLPEMALFCVIDGISLYQSGETSYSVEVILHTLREIVEDMGLSVTFKVIITTCAMRKILVSRNMKMLTLSEDLVGDGEEDDDSEVMSSYLKAISAHRQGLAHQRRPRALESVPVRTAEDYE